MRAEDESTGATGAAVEPAATDGARSSPAGGRRRYLLMAAVPALLLAVGAYAWLTGGRYVSTDNAYVKQNRVTIAADVPGRIVEAAVTENQTVSRGQLLFRIDPEPYRLALAGSDAALASARLQVEQLRAAYDQAVELVRAGLMDLDFAQKTFDRQHGLLAKGVSAQASYDSAENALHSAQQALSQATTRRQAALAALGGDAGIATDAHPTVLAALAKRDEAERDLRNTEVLAPAAGVVSQTDRVRVGQYVAMAGPMLTLIETGSSWVEANFKETDLSSMRVGESATVTLDAYPGRPLRGEVASIGAGTGAEFALLPAQNATGNWVKVVQRIPVRIRFVEPTDGVDLRLGLTASVAVDTLSGAHAEEATGAAAEATAPRQ